MKGTIHQLRLINVIFLHKISFTKNGEAGCVGRAEGGGGAGEVEGGAGGGTEGGGVGLEEKRRRG
jgi:hypothetical protein